MLRVGWERNLSGSEASYTDGSSYVSKLFFLLFIIRFVEVESCRELCSLNGDIFSHREFERPRSVSALLLLGGSFFYFSRCGG